MVKVVVALAMVESARVDLVPGLADPARVDLEWAKARADPARVVPEWARVRADPARVAPVGDAVKVAKEFSNSRRDGLSPAGFPAGLFVAPTGRF